MRSLALPAGALLGAALSLSTAACDTPECIDGPSNLTPEAVASCAAGLHAVPAEDEVVSAGAELLEDGTLVLTWTSWGLECGARAYEIELPETCDTEGWAFTVEIPPELVGDGVTIDLAEHPEVRGSMTAVDGGNGGSRGSIGDEPFFMGALELVEVGEACVTGVFHGFGTGSFDLSLGGPELDGVFNAPRC